MNLFEQVARSYGDNEKMSNHDLYDVVSQKLGIPDSTRKSLDPVGVSGQKHNIFKRKVRWHQQTLKHLGLIERIEGQRGLWHLTGKGKQQLRQANTDVALVAFSTELGIAIWGSHASVFSRLDIPIHLVITSPPYPLRKPRAYGNPKEHEYVDFICRALSPIVARLAPGGSICINISNDIFEEGLPSRSVYLERLVIALHDKLGLSLMDRLVWHNPSKPPGPIQWASKTRQQLNVAWEPVLWFSNNPGRVRADNRRVLQQHTGKHLQLMSNGGEKRETSYSDGAYKLRKGSFGKATAGKIPRNVLPIGHQCSDQKSYRRDAARLGYPTHSAPMPMALPEFLIRFLTEPGELVADPFGGTLTTARVAEKLGRRWISTEWIFEYVRAAAERFADSVGFEPGLVYQIEPATG